MYEFAVTWNPLGGECSHKCSYCSTNSLKKRYAAVKFKYEGEPRFYPSKPPKPKDGQVVFVCAQNDLFAENVPDTIIMQLLELTNTKENTYFFQTKNPSKVLSYIDFLPQKSIICTTIETNRVYPQMGNTPSPTNRIVSINFLSSHVGVDTQVTIEPIMDFDLEEFVSLLKGCNVTQVNIGADSKNNNLPEPSKEKVLSLISELEKFTNVHLKSNLQRLIK